MTPLSELYLHYQTALAELSAKHAEILRENAELAAKLARLEQTLALIQGQHNMRDPNG